MGFSGSVRFRYLVLHYSKISERNFKFLRHLLLGLLVLRPSISSLLQSATAFFITNCDGLLLQSATAFLITKCYKCYYKVQQVLQSVTILLQSATIITKCDSTRVHTSHSRLDWGSRAIF